MNFTPNYLHQIIPEENFTEEIGKIAEALALHAHTGYFTAFDELSLYYEYYLAENSRATIVIVHGLSEFTKKFQEATWYFLNQGYNVFLYDQRCHGFSDRLTDELDMIHVDRFSDYVKDLSKFIDTVVTPNQDKPLYLYSHSMGGAVSLMYMAENPDKIQKTVLSAPLFEVCAVDLPYFLIQSAVTLGKWFIGSKKRFFSCRDFDPDIPFSRSSDKSQARFTYYLSLRKAEPMYRTTPMTYGWTNECLKVKNKLLRKSFIAKIKTPILMIIAEKDTVVKTAPQYAFAEKCSSCKAVTIPEGNHGMLAGTPETITRHIKETLDFFQD